MFGIIFHRYQNSIASAQYRSFFFRSKFKIPCRLKACGKGKLNSRNNFETLHIYELLFFSFCINSLVINEPRREKTGFLHMRKQNTQISFAVTAKLISAFVFATRIVQSLYLLNPKLHASRHFLWLYSPVCVGSCRKPRRPVFSQRDSNINACHRTVHSS